MPKRHLSPKSPIPITGTRINPLLCATRLDIPDSKSFGIVLKHTKKGRGNFGIVLMPTPEELSSDWMGLILKGGFAVLANGVLLGGGVGDIRDTDVRTEEGGSLHLVFCRDPAPTLAVMLGDTVRELHFNSAIPPGDYVFFACVGLGFCVEVEILPVPSMKRRHLSVASLEMMWKVRDFTDAQVVCAGHSIPVHRAVLSTASPVLARIFKGAMQEASSATLEIVDAPPDAVEAMLGYMYTGDLDPAVASQVLPLAHRYQLDQLTSECARLLVQHVGVETVADVVRALRPLREDEFIAGAWAALQSVITGNAELTTAVMEKL